MTELVNYLFIYIYIFIYLFTYIYLFFIFKQIEQNMNLDIKMTTKDGKDLQPVYGPGFTGIENLGNRYIINKN